MKTMLTVLVVSVLTVLAAGWALSAEPAWVAGEPPSSVLAVSIDSPSSVPGPTVLAETVIRVQRPQPKRHVSKWECEPWRKTVIWRGRVQACGWKD